MNEQSLTVVLIVLSILAAAFAALFVLALVSKKRAGERASAAISALEDEKTRISSELGEALRACKMNATMPALLDRAYLSQSENLGIFVFDRVTEKLLVGRSCDRRLTDAITDNGRVRLFDALSAAGSGSELCCEATGHRYSFSFRGDDDLLIYIITDITDRLRVPELTRQLAELRERFDLADIITDVIRLEALIERRAELIPVRSRILMIKTEANETEMLGGSRPEYIKACTAELSELFGSRAVARYSGDCFVCVIPPEQEALAETAISAVNSLHGLLCPIDDLSPRRTVGELIEYTGGEPAPLFESLSVKARADRVDGLFGLIRVEPSEIAALMERRADAVSIIESRNIRFMYEPIAVASNARVYGYELIPYFPGTAYHNIDEALGSAREFGLAHELEQLLFEAAVKAYAKAVKDGKLFFGAAVKLRTLSGTCMRQSADEALQEAYYDYLKSFIVHIDGDPTDDVSAHKRRCIDRMGAHCAVTGTDRVDENLVRLGKMSPELVCLPIETIKAPGSKTAIKDITSRIHKAGGYLLVEGIEKPAELEAAIAAGADLLRGPYIGEPDDEPSEVSDRCMKKIGQIQFGKRP